MAFLTKHFNAATGKWTAVAKSISSYDTKRMARDIEKASTISYADIIGVLYALPDVMSRYLADGHTVKLEGIGTFFLTVQCTKTGVDSPEQVTPDLVNNVKVQFRPEMTNTGYVGDRRKGRRAKNLVSEDIEWHMLADDNDDR